MLQLYELQHNQGKNYILPFLWMHGESEADLRREIAKIDECSVKAFCVESRPHPDFTGKRWWRDMDIVIDEAGRRAMKVWILDDAQFPTGYAAGQAKNADPAFKKQFLFQRLVSVVGPLKGAALLPPVKEGELFCVAACPMEKDGRLAPERCVDLTDRLVDGAVYWDIPEGLFAVCYFYIDRRGIIANTEDYINPLTAGGTDILLQAVYESHFEHYADEFGKTIAGFFSDEPGLYSEFSYENHLGSPAQMLPWSDDMAEMLKTRTGLTLPVILPSLFLKQDVMTAAVQYAYMDVVSELYEKNFSERIGRWCREHRVEYMGHIIEDNNAHARIGFSAGHFFRSTAGQDYAGIDVVLNQILPGMDEITHSCTGAAPADGEFFAYLLAQMAASQAQLEPKKRGRAMCEIFGAYGWAEGTKQMKWLVDFMLVRGINWFVPHAFSPAPFPDPDCPPHFYAGGRNPQFKGFAKLMPYTNRMAHLLSDGRHAADAAILYHAQAEWTGVGFMLSQKPARVLAQAQISFDIVPLERLSDALIRNRRLEINGQSYTVLIVPYTKLLSKEAAQCLSDIRQKGVDVVFIDGYPDTVFSRDGKRLPRRDWTGFRLCALRDIAGYCREKGCDRLALEEGHPSLRVYHYRHHDAELWLLFNEHPYSPVRDTLLLPAALIKQPCVQYDALDNAAYSITIPQDGRLPIEIEPYQSVLLLFGSTGDIQTKKPQAMHSCCRIEPEEWNLSLCREEEYPAFRPYKTLRAPDNLNKPDELARFSGILRYETAFDYTGPTDHALLDLGRVYETAEVFLNGRSLGLRFCPPYRFDAGGCLHQGKNRLSVEVRNHLAYEIRDEFSAYLPLEPIGLLGPITIRF